MKGIIQLFLSGILFMYAIVPTAAAASQKSPNEQTILPTSSGKQSNQKEQSETNYLIGLKRGVKSDEFIKKKGYQKKQKKPKKAKNANLVMVSLDKLELQNLKQDADVSFIEEDALVQIDNVEEQNHGSIEKEETPGTLSDQPSEQPVDQPEQQSNEQPVNQEDQQQPEQPSDPLNEPEQTESTETIPWGIRAIGGEYALQKNMEGTPIKIAVLDTGIAIHPDLRVAGGVSFVPETSDPTDDNGHGTHVAGIIGALHNDAGVVGAAPNAEMYAVKVLDQNGRGTYSQVIQGIEWAIDNKMNVISMSFGGSADSKALQEAIHLAHEKGILLIASAGNKGIGDETETYPALFPDVISVGAVNQENKRASFSSTGPQLDLVAPGVDIESTLSNGTYGKMSGTSMAAPHVTGAAAALWSAHPELTADEVTPKLYETATPLGKSDEYGHGLVNEAYALDIISGPVTNPVPIDPTPTPIPDDETFVQSYDKKAAGIVKKLEALKEAALKKENGELAKEIDQHLHEFMIMNMEEHQLPSELEQASKEELASSAFEEDVNQYYQSKKSVFLSLMDSYQQQNAAYEKQLRGSVMNSQGEAAAQSDLYEPNDSFETAYPLPASQNVYESYLSTGSDVDFYSFKPTQTGTMTINLIPPDGKDYDVFVLIPITTW